MRRHVMRCVGTSVFNVKGDNVFFENEKVFD